MTPTVASRNIKAPSQYWLVDLKYTFCLQARVDRVSADFYSFELKNSTPVPSLLKLVNLQRKAYGKGHQFFKDMSQIVFWWLFKWSLLDHRGLTLNHNAHAFYFFFENNFWSLSNLFDQAKSIELKTCSQGLLGFDVQNGRHSTPTTENSTDCYRLKNQKIQLIILTLLVRLIALPWICFRGHK